MTDFYNNRITRGVAFSNEIEYLLQTQLAVVDHNLEEMSDTEDTTGISPSDGQVGTQSSVNIVHHERSKQIRHESIPLAQEYRAGTDSTESSSRFQLPTIDSDYRCEIRGKSNLFQRMGKALRALLLKSRNKKQQPSFVFRPLRCLDQESCETNPETQRTPQLLAELAPNLVRTHSQNMRKGVTRRQRKPPDTVNPDDDISSLTDTKDLFLRRIKQSTQTYGYMSKDGSLLFDSPQGNQARLTRFVGLSQENIPHLDHNLFKDFDWGLEGVDRPISSSSLDPTNPRTIEFSMRAMHCASAQNSVALIDDQRLAAEAFLEMEYQQGGLTGCMRKKRLEQTALNNYVYQMYSTNTKKAILPGLRQHQNLGSNST